MNGRVYDPVLGRFLSADPNIDGVEDAQGYNRYSYVGNNPMNATDPSGFFSLKDGLKIAAAIVVGIITAGVALYAYTTLIYGGTFVGGLGGAISSVGLAAGWGGGFAISAGAGFGFGSAFAGSLLNGGSIGDALKAGVIGAVVGGISAGIASKIGDFAASHEWFAGTGQNLAHGVLQGSLTEATGGEFRHGFYAGFSGSALGSSVGTLFGGTRTGNLFAAAIVGGTASAIGGGKFANGAVAAAFTQMFNHSGHETFSEGEAEIRIVESAAVITPAGLHPEEYDSTMLRARVSGKVADKVVGAVLKRFAPKIRGVSVEGNKPVGNNLPGAVASKAASGFFENGAVTVAGAGAGTRAMGFGVSIWSKVTYEIRRSFFGFRYWSSAQPAYELVVNQSGFPTSESWAYKTQASAMANRSVWESAYMDALRRNVNNVVNSHLGQK